MTEKIRKILDRTLESVLIVIMGAMVLNVLWQVFTRFVLQDPSSYTEELARFMLIWLGLLGAGYAAGKKMHLAIDVLVNKLTGAFRIGLELFIEICIAVFALFIMIVGGIRLVGITLHLEQISAALQIQLGYVYLAVPISGLFILIYMILAAIEQIGLLKTGREVR